MKNNRKKVITLGFFDGVHLGHQALMKRAVELAQQKNMTPAVFTFDRSPREYITGIPLPLLTSAEERKTIIRTLFPIDDVIIAPFDQEMMTMAWTDFMQMLANKYQAGWVVVGHDYRFGYKNMGNPQLLAENAVHFGMGCDIVPAVTLDGITVSSTHIRNLLKQGNLHEAERFLGHPLPPSCRVFFDNSSYKMFSQNRL